MKLIKKGSKEWGDSSLDGGLDWAYIQLDNDESEKWKVAREDFWSKEDNESELWNEVRTMAFCFLKSQRVDFSAYYEIKCTPGEFFRREPSFSFFRNRLIVSSSWGFDC